jgi:O-antigen ligase
MTAPAPPPPASAPPWAAAAFVGFFGFLMVVLNWVFDPGAIDETMMPRLLAVSVFLAAAVAVAALPPVARRLDGTLLAEPIVLLCAGYALVTVLSLLVAFNPSAGFTDVFRTLATLVTLALACLLLAAVPRWREWFLRVAVVAGAGLALTGGWQIAERLVSPQGFDLRDRHALEEITGVMSNVNLFAGMLVLALPWCLAAAVLGTGRWRAAAVLAAAGQACLLVVLQSRAAWLAAAVGAVVASLAVGARPEAFGLPRRARRFLVGGWTAALALLVGGIAAAPADHALARRFRSIFDEASAEALGLPREGGRLMIWRITAEMIGDHLLTGVGAGNFMLRLPEYFVDESLDFSTVHTNWLEPHNDFLWVFSEKGLPGILLFAGIFVAAARALGRVLVAPSPPTASASAVSTSAPSAATAAAPATGVVTADRWLALAAATGLASYATLSSFDFPLERITHQVSLAMLLAVTTVVARAARPAAPPPVRAAGGPLVGAALAGGAIVALGLGAVYATAALRQEKDVIAQRRAWRDGDYEGVLAASRRADTPWKTLDPYASPVAFLEGMAHVQLGHTAEGVAALERAMDQNPNRMYVANNLAIQYLGAGRIDEALELFAMLCDAYPHRIEPLNNLAGCLIEAGRFADAAMVLEQIPEELRTEVIRGNIAYAKAQAQAHPAPAVAPAPAGE